MNTIDLKRSSKAIRVSLWDSHSSHNRPAHMKFTKAKTKAPLIPGYLNKETVHQLNSKHRRIKKFIRHLPHHRFCGCTSVLLRSIVLLAAAVLWSQQSIDLPLMAPFRLVISQTQRFSSLDSHIPEGGFPQKPKERECMECEQISLMNSTDRARLA